MSIVQDNTERRILAAVVLPQTKKQGTTSDLEQDSPLKNHLTALSINQLDHFEQKRWEPTVKEKKDPYPERLDNKHTLMMLLRTDAKEISADNPQNFKKVSKTLVDAKNHKREAAREAEKLLKKQKRLEEEAELAELEALKLKAQPRKHRQMSIAERMAEQKPKFDMSTYAGKLKMLIDVKEKKYQLPPDFPTMNEIDGKGRKFMSAHFAKTQARHQTIEQAREGRIQEMFVDDMPEL